MNSKAAKSTDMDLDGAGIIYPYVATRRWNSVYRIEATLKFAVNPTVLACVIENLSREYPYFFKTIARTKTKYVLRKCAFDTNTVYSKSAELCKPFDLESGKPLIRFLYNDRTVALEMFHSLTDGHGAMELMKELLKKYRNIIDPSAEILPKENDNLNSENDIFESIYENGGKNISRILPSTYQIKAKRSSGFDREIINIPCKELVDSAHRYGVSVAMMLCALQIKAIADSQNDVHGYIGVSVPVDLRKMFSVSSCRNSSLYIIVSAKAKDAENFEELLKIVQKQFKEKLTKENMQNTAYTNVSSAKLKIFKMLPVCIKKPILKFGYSHLGENQFTTTMTDIGIIRLDDELSRIVEEIFFVLGKQKTKPINTAISTYNGTAKIVVSYDTDCSDFVYALNGLIDRYITPFDRDGQSKE